MPMVSLEATSTANMVSPTCWASVLGSLIIRL
jgi:hypothetical protein